MKNQLTQEGKVYGLRLVDGASFNTCGTVLAELFPTHFVPQLGVVPRQQGLLFFSINASDRVELHDRGAIGWYDSVTSWFVLGLVYKKCWSSCANECLRGQLLVLGSQKTLLQP